MARVTVEDCILKIPNRFELVMLAAQRSRDITAGAPLTVDRDNDKNPVVALREIADETIGPEALKATLIKGLQRHVEVDEPEEDEVDLLAIQQEFGTETSATEAGDGTDGVDAGKGDAIEPDVPAADAAESTEAEVKED